MLGSKLIVFILALAPHLSTDEAATYAEEIRANCARSAHYLIAAIIDVESDFQHAARSSTGDHGILQINREIWGSHADGTSAEQIRWACGRLAELHAKYSVTEKFWFARYHSGTPRFKHAYGARVMDRLRVLQSLEADQAGGQREAR